MSKRVLIVIVALVLFGLLLSKMVGQYFIDVLAKLEQVETYKWYPAEAEAIYETIAEDYPDSDYALEAQKNLVISYISAKRNDDARRALDKLVEGFSEHSALQGALYDIARKYEQSRKYEKAKSIYQQIIQQYPDSRCADRVQLDVPKIDVLSHIESKNYSAARSAIDSLIADFSSHPDLPSSLYDIARRYERAERYKESEHIYQQVVLRYPDSSSARSSQLGVARMNVYCLIESREYSEAQVAVDSLITDFSADLCLSESLYDVAGKYVKLRRYEEAKSAYQQIIQRYPDSSHASRAQLNIPKINIYSFVDSGQIEEAQTAVDSLAADFSGHSYLPATLHQIARKCERLKEYEAAKTIYQQVIQQCPDSSYADKARRDIPKSRIMSLIYSGQTGGVQEAIDNFIADFNDYPSLYWAVFRIGEEYYSVAFRMKEMGLDAEAEEQFRKAIALWERIIQEFPVSFVTTMSYSLSAACYRELGEYEKVIEYCQAVLDNWPDYEYAWDAQYTIAFCFERLRDSDRLPPSQANPQIEQAYEAVLENYPDSPPAEPASLRLGRMSFKKEQWDTAAAYFELYLSKSTYEQKLHNVVGPLGRAYEKMGQLDLAAELYEEFLETADPNDPYIEGVKARLGELGGQN